MEVRPIRPHETRALRQAVLRPHETLEQVAARERPDAFAVGGFLDGELIAAGMIVQEPLPGEAGAEDWRVQGMATAAPARGQGAGSAVLAALIEHARAHGAARVWCNARTPALNLYLRAGFTVISEEFELPMIGPHFRVVRSV